MKVERKVTPRRQDNSYTVVFVQGFYSIPTISKYFTSKAEN